MVVANVLHMSARLAYTAWFLREVHFGRRLFSGGIVWGGAAPKASAAGALVLAGALAAASNRAWALSAGGSGGGALLPALSHVAVGALGVAIVAVTVVADDREFVRAVRTALSQRRKKHDE